MEKKTYLIKAEVCFTVESSDPRETIVLADQHLYAQKVDDWKITSIMPA